MVWYTNYHGIPVYYGKSMVNHNVIVRPQFEWYHWYAMVVCIPYMEAYYEISKTYHSI